MKHLKHLTIFLSLLLALCLPVAAEEAVTVLIDGAPLNTSAAQSRIHNGSTYVPLVDFAAAVGLDSVRWDGSAARVAAGGMTVTAAPGQSYLTAGERCFYLPSGVMLTEGRTLVPVTALAAAYGFGVAWDGRTATVSLTSGAGKAFSGYDGEELDWLSRIISAESRGEPLAGQIAVGNVVRSRVASSQFPDSLPEVILDTRYGVQFEPVSNGTLWDEPAAISVLAAKMVLEGANTAGNSLYFYNPSLSNSTWFDENRTHFTTIGCHRFYL